MQPLFQFFYRMYGVRRPQQMLSPPTALETAFQLPRDAIYHHTGLGLETDELTDTMPLFDQYAKRICVDHVMTLDDVKGNPMRTGKQANVLVRNFHQKNKRFRFLADAYKIANDPMTLIVEDYTFLNELYKYTAVPMSDYYRWWNVQKTLWTRIANISEVSDREQFVFVNVPTFLPSFMSLNFFKRETSVSMLKIFDSPEKLFLLEIWKWLSEDTKDKSCIATVKDSQLTKINLVFKCRGKVSVVNLGYLNSWLKDSGEVIKDAGALRLDHIVLQKFFLKYVIQLKSVSEIETDAEVLKDSEVLLPQNQADPSVNNDGSQDEDGEDAGDNGSLMSDVVAGKLKLKENTTKLSATVPEVVDDGNVGDDTFDIDSHLASIDEDLKTLDFMEKKAQIGNVITVSANAEGKARVTGPDEMTILPSPEEVVYKVQTAEDMLIQHIEQQAEYGVMSASDYRNAIKQANAYKNLPDPYGSAQSITEASVIEPEELVIKPEETVLKDNDTVLDKSMLSSSLQAFDKKYVSTVMTKDILSMTTAVQKAGFIIQSHQVETEVSITGAYEYHVLKIKPVDGVASTIRFKLPKVNAEGQFTANGNKYVMRKQRSDLPIRKINAVSVALSSYYGKAFISRNAKRTNDPIAWIAKSVMLRGMSGTDTVVLKVSPANVFDNLFKAPQIYSAMAEHFKAIQLKDYLLMFDHRDRIKLFDDTAPDTKDLSALAKLNAIENNGTLVVTGVSTANEVVLVDRLGQFFVRQADGVLKDIGTIYDLLGLDEEAAPIGFIDLKIFSKLIPVGVVLSYLMGFDNLLKFLKVEYRTIEPRKLKRLEKHEWVIAFKDVHYIFSKKDARSTLILGGFLPFEKSVKNYFHDAFNNRNVYLNILEGQSISTLYLREMELMDQLFVDPVTLDILKEMKEPQTFKGLLVRSVELLLDHTHKDPQDMTSMRIKGYERFSGAVYKEMVASIRSYKSRNIRGKSQIELNPYAVWRNVLSDTSIKIVEDINPIQNLKESESVTHTGEGGRSKDAMNKKSRAYHESDLGTISEATVDSGDVGVNVYLSANPSLTGLRGISKPYVEGDKNYASMISTSALLSPGAMNDNAMRVGFISIQHGHTIAADGYHQSPVRTGYETVLAQRSGEMFAYSAEQVGKVVSKNDLGIIVEYADGSKKGVQLGRRYGKAEGSVYPHDIVCTLNVGDVFVAGDVIAYNAGFFEPDMLDPKRVTWKSSMFVKTALYESSQTHEDSSSVSKKLSVAMTAKTTKIRSFTVEFKQQLHKVVKPGTFVEPGSVLLIMEDEATAGMDVFDEETLDTLKRLSNKAPKAKYKGVVERIEIFYHGGKEDMSPTLRALTNASDKSLADGAKATGATVLTGEVDNEYRVAGTPLSVDTAEIKIYITVSAGCGVGDKGVFANQLKTVVGEVMDYPMTTESGETIDSVFGYKSIFNRIVHSPLIIGTTATLLKVISKRAVAIYKGAKNG